MKAITQLNEADFDRAMAAAGTPVLVDFSAPWCGPCKLFAPLLDKLVEHYAGRIQFLKVNVDDAPELARRFEIAGVPTLLLISNGEVRDVIVGFPSPRVLVDKLEGVASANVAEALT